MYGILGVFRTLVDIDKEISIYKYQRERSTDIFHFFRLSDHLNIAT